ncbi:MAG: hypothetical protein IJ319_02135 [Bacteroidaceae bacterium]|nr:hypothetical protein [Bacteroidaceae bacterium]
MVSEEELQRFIDCRTSTEEGRRILSQLKNDDELGEILFAEAATALMDDSTFGVGELSADELAEYEALRKRAIVSQPEAELRKIGYRTDDEDSSSVAAEPDVPYGTL